MWFGGESTEEQPEEETLRTLRCSASEGIVWAAHNVFTQAVRNSLWIIRSMALANGEASSPMIEL